MVTVALLMQMFLTLSGTFIAVIIIIIAVPLSLFLSTAFGSNPLPPSTIHAHGTSMTGGHVRRTHDGMGATCVSKHPVLLQLCPGVAFAELRCGGFVLLIH